MVALPSVAAIADDQRMKSLEQYLASYHQAVQAAIPDEPVLAVGMLSVVGSTKSIVTGLISPLAGMLQRNKGRKLAVGFPNNVLIAVTPARLIAFDYRPTASSVKIKRTVMEFLRRDVRVELVPPAKQRGLHHLRFWLPDGSTPELELPRGIGRSGEINDPFLSVVLQPVAR